MKEVERGNGLEANLLSQGAGEVKMKWKGTQLDIEILQPDTNALKHIFLI